MTRSRWRAALRCSAILAALVSGLALAEDPQAAGAQDRAGDKRDAGASRARKKAERSAAPAAAEEGRAVAVADRMGDRTAAAAGPAGSSREDGDPPARALERLLVQQGGLLLPVWRLEIAPAVAYAHSASDSTITLAGQTFSQRVRAHLFTSSLTLRFGLPWELQAESAFSFSTARQSSVLANSVSNNAASTGLGDSRFALTRQLLHGSKAIPDLLVTAFWRAPTGSSPWDADPHQVGLGNGSHALGGTLSAVKAADPLVFLASGSLTHDFAANTAIGRIEPGNEWGLDIGAFLAVSPDTSISFTVDQKYQPPIRLNGSSLPGTDRTGATFQVGVAMLLSSRTFLNVTSGIGLTSDVPRFQLAVSAPFQPH